MKQLILGATACIYFGCFAAAESQIESLMSAPEFVKIVGAARMPHQLAFGTYAKTGIPVKNLCACLVADPHLENFPPDSAQKLITYSYPHWGRSRLQEEENPLEHMLQQFRDNDLSNEALEANITTPKVVALFIASCPSYNGDQFSVLLKSYYHDNETVKIQTPFTSDFVSTENQNLHELWLVKREEESSISVCEEFRTQENVRSLQKRGAHASLERVWSKKLESQDYDLALAIDGSLLRTYYSEQLLKSQIETLETQITESGRKILILKRKAETSLTLLFAVLTLHALLGRN